MTQLRPLTSSDATAVALAPDSGLARAVEGPFRILIATDAWRPQINGVVRTLEGLAEEAPRHGTQISFLTPEGHRSIPMPSYPEIRLSLAGPGAIARRIEEERPNAIHIATEGPIGFWVRRYCMNRKIPFTTCYHTRYPEYLAARLPVPLWASYGWLRRFHNAAAATRVAATSSTPPARREAAAHAAASSAAGAASAAARALAAGEAHVSAATARRWHRKGASNVGPPPGVGAGGGDMRDG